MTIREKLAKGIVEIENYRLPVHYMIIHPSDINDIKKEFEIKESVKEDSILIWNIKVVVADVVPEKIILLCSQLIEPEPPTNQHQITFVVDIS